MPFIDCWEKHAADGGLNDHDKADMVALIRQRIDTGMEADAAAKSVVKAHMDRTQGQLQDVFKQAGVTAPVRPVEAPPAKAEPTAAVPKETPVETGLISRIANRFTQERTEKGQLGEVEPGPGYDTKDMIERGLRMKPEEIAQHVSDVVHDKGGDPARQAMAIRAEEARLSDRSAQASRAARQSPNDPELQRAADETFQELTQFHNGPVAKLKTRFHATGMGLQAAVPVDLGTLNGLREAWLRKGGEPPGPKEQAALQKLADRYDKSNTTADQLARRKEIYDELTKAGREQRTGSLEEAEKAAKLRLKKNAGQGGFVSPDILRDAAVLGAAHIKRGLTNFRDWSSRMVRDIGEHIRPHLANLWAKAQQLAKSFVGRDTLEQAKERGHFGTGGGLSKERIEVGGSHSRIGERLITGKSATETNGPHLKVDLESALKHPKSFETNTNVIKNYSFLRDVADKSPREIAETYIEHFKNNLLWLHDKMPEAWRKRAQQWYPGGNKLTHKVAIRYGIEHEAAAGVSAALSPQQDWFRNISLAHRVIDTVREHADHPWDEEMSKTMDRIYGKDVYASIRKEIDGKSLDQVDNRLARAAWVRTYDEAHNPRSYHIVTPEGDYGPLKRNKGGDLAAVGWGSNRDIAKAMDILENPTPENISKQIGENHKVRNFYNDLIDPKNKEGSITVDTHAVAAGIMLPVSGSSLEVDQNFGGGGASSSKTTGALGLYPFNAEAYRRAAAERGIRPNAMQSITWEAIRGIFRPEFKRNAKNVAEARAIWDRFGRGEINENQARNEVFKLAGGITPPDWVDTKAGRSAGVSGKVRSAKDKAELSDVRVSSGREAGPRDIVGTDTGIPELAGQRGPLGFLDRQEAAARERIAGRRGRLNVGIDPGALIDEAVIGAAHIARGLRNFDEWSKKMIADIGEHIRPHLRSIWEESKKMAAAAAGKRVPLTEEQRTGAKLKRTQTDIKSIRAKIAAGDLTRPTKPEPIQSNDKLEAALKEKKRVVKEFNQLYAKKQFQSRPLLERGLIHTGGIARAFAISGYHTLGKIFSFSGAKVISQPLEELSGAIGENLPGIGPVIKGASMEGGSHMKSLGAYYSGLATKGMKAAHDTLFKGGSESEALYGKTHDITEHEHPVFWYDYMGGIFHGAEKNIISTAAEESYKARAYQHAIDMGHDPNDPVVRGVINAKAYEWSQWDKLQEKGMVADAVNGFFKRMEATDPTTGRANMERLLMSTIIKAFVTKGIIKTPANYLAQSIMQHSPIGLGRAIVKGAAGRIRGIDNMTDLERNTVARLFKAGMVGTAMTVWGAYDATRPEEDRIFGGYYDPKKRTADDVPFGRIRIAGKVMPHFLTHNLLTEPAQMGNTIVRVMKQQFKGKERGAVEGILTALLSPLENAPISGGITRITEGAKPGKGRQVASDMVRNLVVPQLVQNLAEDTDFGVEKRKANTFFQGIYSGIPGARETLDEKQAKTPAPADFR